MEVDKHIYNRPIIDSLLELEKLEMLEQEKYISNLQFQREKIEEFAEELSKRNARISDLENELQHLKSHPFETEKYTIEITYLKQTLKSLELENTKLRSKFTSQADEYNLSINELKSIVLKEREEKDKQIFDLKSELLSKEDDLETLIDAFDKAKSTLSSLEKKYELEINSFKSKEKTSYEQAKTWKLLEKTLKEENNILKNENLALKDSLNVANDKISDNAEIEEENENLRLAVIDGKNKHKELTKKYIEACDKYELLKKNIDTEFNGLKEELDQAIEIISRQENNIQDLRGRKQQDDARISALIEELERKKMDIMKIQKNSIKNDRNEEDYKEKIKELEFKIRTITGENNLVKAELDKIKERQEKERNERKKITKKKLEMLTQRNEEISKISQAFSTLDL
ncbi:hypothetical protein SteCoe_32813 [Stentor coeruleus]|uniref:Uncharacterized protein n=1 Tax=Stentor coeruleus TaxID=5963 RepID=A0A1R2AY83_9CILI|nr:hypothetical protein SteCoe_32813 [Stentor coeruleus]